jgi:hypothetical protein
VIITGILIWALDSAWARLGKGLGKNFAGNDPENGVAA